MISAQKYPALMAYIFARNLIPKTYNPSDHQAMKARGETPPPDWLSQLAADSAEARAGGLAEVAQEMAQAKADFFAQRAADGLTGRPHPDALPEFLGLAGRPEQGLQMAIRVLTSWLEGGAPTPEWTEVKEEMEETGGD